MSVRLTLDNMSETCKVISIEYKKVTHLYGKRYSFIYF